MRDLKILVLEAATRRYRLRTLRPGNLDQDAPATYLLPSGEALCQYVLRENPEALVIARGPLAFLAGNKTTVGYISPLTGLPHYSFVGGRGFAELLNLGLDAIVFQDPAGAAAMDTYVRVSGRAPDLHVAFKPAADLPTGQRSAFYALLARELDGHRETGSVFTLGEAARHGYRTANMAVDGLYHAGRGGAGGMLARFTAALVLCGQPMTPSEWLGPRADAFFELRDGEIRRRLEQYGVRFSRRTGGTVTKLYATGSGDHPTLPARNAQRLGYALADLGAREVLKASRVGQTGCHWCQLNCRHWHWVEADYAPQERDMFLDDFEPTYALFAMLDLQPEGDALQERLRLLDEVDRRLVLPIEQMGSDVIDVGVGLAALFEGLEQGLVPVEDVPQALQDGPSLGNLDRAAAALTALRAGDASPALRALGDGPEALAARYPGLRQRVFTGGRRTLANPGHANALWTFLMPFSRFFSHYSGQIYKVPGQLPPDLDPPAVAALFQRVVGEMLQREFYSCLGNALSTCAFTFVIFSQDGQGVTLDEDDLLVRTLAAYGIETRREELEWFAQAFWARSIALKLAHGWQAPCASDFPERVFEALSTALGHPVATLRALMDQLIAEWQRQAGVMLYKYGYTAPADWPGS